MNERFRLNSELIWERLEKDHRKLSWLQDALVVSKATVGRMMNKGHVPKPRKLRVLAKLLGVQESDLLIPKDEPAEAKESA